MLFLTSKDLSALKDRIEDVERGLRKIQLEWEDSFDRLRVMAGRIARQVKERQEEQPEPDIPAPPDSDPSLHLNPHQNAIQQRLLARRSRVMRPPTQ